jgi:hypothetical protein
MSMIHIEKSHGGAGGGNEMNVEGEGDREGVMCRIQEVEGHGTRFSTNSFKKNKIGGGSRDEGFHEFY